MGNDTVFSIYAALLVSAVFTLLTAIVVSGTAAVPAPLFVLEHFGLGLLFRASYKSLEGPGWPFRMDEAEVVAGADIPGALGAEG
jgi:hypothetical protein